jgi:predicted PurR-regulated permease PerM
LKKERGNKKMIFERDKYYSYIQSLEKSVTIYYVVIMIFAVLLGIATGLVTLIITIPLGMFISWIMTFATKVKIQEMKWKIDMYDKTNYMN